MRCPFPFIAKIEIISTGSLKLKVTNKVLIISQIVLSDEEQYPSVEFILKSLVGSFVPVKVTVIPSMVSVIVFPLSVAVSHPKVV